MIDCTARVTWPLERVPTAASSVAAVLTRWREPGDTHISSDAIQKQHRFYFLNITCGTSHPSVNPWSSPFQNSTTWTTQPMDRLDRDFHTHRATTAQWDSTNTPPSKPWVSRSWTPELSQLCRVFSRWTQAAGVTFTMCCHWGESLQELLTTPIKQEPFPYRTQFYNFRIYQKNRNILIFSNNFNQIFF